MERGIRCCIVAIAAVALLSLSPVAFGWLDPATDPSVLKILNTEDNQFSFYASPGQQTEWLYNYGLSSGSRLKANQDATGMKFDLAEHRGKTVAEAELHLAYRDGEKVYSLVASTFNTDWHEGMGTGVGAACTRWRSTPVDPNNPQPGDEWTFSHSDVMTAAFGNFGSLVSFGFKANGTFRTYTVGTQEWWAFKLDPAVVHALILDQYGLMVTDARGHGISNPRIYTKDQNASLQPRLYIKFADTQDTAAPGPVTNLAAEAGPENGQVVLRFLAPADMEAPKAFGYNVRYSSMDDFASATEVDRWRIPRPKMPGMLQRMLLENLQPNQTYYFYVQAYDAAGNVSPVQKDSLRVPAAVATPVLPDGPFVAPDPTGKTVASVPNVLRYWAASEIAKINPVTGNRMEDGYTGSGADNYKKANVVWDSATNTISLLAGKNEVVAAQLVVEKLTSGTLNNVSLTASDLTRAGGGKIPAQAIEFSQLYYIKSGTTYYPEPAIPLGPAPLPATFNIPDSNRNPTGKNQSVFVDVYVPKDAPAGDYTGTITINATQLPAPVTVNLAVKVVRTTIPDQPTFLVDLNGYGNPWDWGYSKDLLVLRYFQTAHKHRVVTNCLPYGWTAVTRPDRTPGLTGSGSTLHISDWNTFDKRYGPLFDGTAFTPINALSPYYGPGMSAPVTHFYSTFFESWPIQMKDPVYGFDAMGMGPDYWYELKQQARSNTAAKAEMFTNLPDVYDAFPDGYKQGLRNATADWFRHAHDKGWTKTAFQIYHNHKWDYDGAAVFWAMEENVTADDFRSLGFWQQLWRDGQALANTPDVKWHFRIDISDRWGQNYGELDNRINFWMMGSSAAGWHFPHMKYRNYLLDADKPEEWNWYGGGTSPTTQGISYARLFLQKWSQGFTGGIPYWNNYSNSWSALDDLSTVYKGDSIPGQTTAYLGIIPSIRLKMMRQSEQVIELLNLWAGRPGMNRQRVRDAVFAKYGTAGTWDYSFAGVDENKLYKMRADLLTLLEPAMSEMTVTDDAGLSASGLPGGPFSPLTKTYTVTNTGPIELAWTAGAALPWVTLDKTSGTLAPGQSDTVQVYIGTEVNGFAAGIHNNMVTFTNTTDHGGDAIRVVSVKVFKLATLDVTPTDGFTAKGVFGGPFVPQSKSYTLNNTGEFDLEWTAGVSQPWITLDKTSGTLAPGASTNVVVSLTSVPVTYDLGTYTDTLVITNITSGIGNATRSMSLAVVPPGALSVSPAESFTPVGPNGGPFPATKTYTLTNTGGADLNWTANAGQPWVTLDKTSGTLASGQSTTVVVGINNTTAATFGRGTYYNTVTFTNTIDGVGNTSRQVVLSVVRPAALLVEPAENLVSEGLVGGPFSLMTKEYTLTNTGQMDLAWSSSLDQTWVTLSQTSGTLAPGASVTVTASLVPQQVEALAADVYRAVLEFKNDTNQAGNAILGIQLSVLRLAALAVDPAEAFGAIGDAGGPFNVTSKDYTLTNSGEAALDWSAGVTQPWLVLSQTTGTLAAGESVTVTVSLTGQATALPADLYQDAVTFTNITNGAGNTTRDVILIVNEATAPGWVGDINEDGWVDVGDLLIFVASWGKNPGDDGYDPACNLDGADGVDVTDLMLLAENWGKGPDTKVPGDLSGDGVVDIEDWMIFSGSWGTLAGDANYNPECDFDANGCVDMTDWQTFLEYWPY